MVKTLFLYGFFFFHGFTALWAVQDTANIKNVAFEFSNNEAIIHYDIENSSRYYKFYIELHVYTPKGTEVPAISLKGDVNKLVEGGADKFIYWDIKNDYDSFNDSLIVEVIATQHISFNAKEFVFWSVAYPGYVNYKEKKHIPYLFIGATTYGLLATSFIFEGVALNSYNKYKTSNTLSIREDFYNQAKGYRKISDQLLYTSLGIWVSNIAISYLIHSNFENKISIGVQPNYLSNLKDNIFVPCLTINLKLNEG